MRCPRCGCLMIEIADKCDDGVIWSCRKMFAGVRHQKKLSIRTGSFFSGIGISIQDTLYALYEWTVMTSVSNTMFELKLAEKTVISMFGKFREIAARNVGSRMQDKIGSNEITEIVEC